MRTGETVICTDDNFSAESHKRIPTLPMANEQYTIRDITTTRNGKAVWLEEISNPKVQGDLGSFEPSFAARRFRMLTPDEQLVLIEDEELAV